MGRERGDRDRGRYRGSAFGLAGFLAEELVVFALHPLVGLRIGRRFALAGDVGPKTIAVFAVELEPGFGLWFPAIVVRLGVRAGFDHRMGVE